MTEFVAWGKTPRYFRDIVITEKIDGTNAAVVIEQHPFGHHANYEFPADMVAVVLSDIDESGTPEFEYVAYAQSRKRLITPAADNAGFAAWVRSNAGTLVRDLGPGRHFGEWWGRGIQRGYGMPTKVFSLFNTKKWLGVPFTTPLLHVVPVLYEGEHTEDAVREALDGLREYGSAATVDFDDHEFGNPEGVVIFHTASNGVFKVTLVDDQTPKSIAA